MSLIKCWASKDPKTSAGGEETISGSDTALVSFVVQAMVDVISIAYTTVSII